MKEYICFENDGEIDLNFLRLFGVSVKGDNAIGFFGTGLKYALAILMREEQEVIIYSGEQRYEIGTSVLNLRDVDFEQVEVDGERLSFTTELGKTWEVWQAIRELEANCRDENGKSYRTKDCGGLPGETCIYVRGEKALTEYAKIDQIFLQTTPSYSTGSVDVHRQASKFLYYRGVRAYSADRPTVHTYSLTSGRLTEDRTIYSQWDANATIAMALLKCEDRSVLWPVLTAGNNHYEHFLDFDWPHSYVSDTFLDTALDARRHSYSDLPPSVHEVLRRRRKKALYVPVTLTAVERLQLERATAFAQSLNFDPQPYTVKVIQTMGEQVLALAASDDDLIVLSRRLFDMGTKQVALALIEEVIHLRENLSDCTRGFQTHVLERLVSLGEELRGEPL